MAWFPGCGDDDEFPDPEIGPFGDEGLPKAPPQPRDPRREAEARRLQERRERDRKVSSDFNRHMIDLFNSRQKP